MKRFWPKSLGAQLALLVALALGVAQAVNFALLLQATERQNYGQTATLAVARLAEAVQRTRTGQTTPEMMRGSLATNTSPITTGMKLKPELVGYAREMLAQVGIHVGAIKAAEVPAREFQVQVDGQGRLLRKAAVLQRRVIVVSAEIQSGRWITTAAPLPPLNPGVFGWLIFQTFVLYGFVLLTVLWVGGRLARPLAELRHAAERFDRRSAPQPIEEQGPADIRRLIAAFNTMRTRITAMLDEKDRMLGAIGHDLRTPLASLRVRTELVEDDAERARMATTIDDMNRTLDDILSLARLGRPSEPEQRVDLPALIDSVVEEFEDLGADVTVEEADRLTVPMRPNLIKRALRNLIENALKYGSCARVRVRPDGGDALVEVDDDGPGIPPEEIERMFEAFTRLEASRSRDTGGTGLGLALARAIVDAHGGTLILANRGEGGLRATMRLPL
ncbi:HAMP domain-containing protein [Sphingomonas sp. ID1715]|uniref:sensor histidine kinase n=1 Tax=Sphingomonas sp. ID1715 TaxID=1656898 RepID=UPI00148812C9|nr:ATP-binding protein [Sphingomonas sp. ID1715]NNM76234.1 HAMP domain-containing protein [Sphingomonas sp. ID1715]